IPIFRTATTSKSLRRCRGDKMNIDVQKIKEKLVKVAALTDIEISENDITIELWPAPHKPSALPKGKIAVYAFFLQDECLKIGKANSKSSARYHSQHYNPNSANSNLAKSILLERSDLVEADINAWIKQNISRANFLISDIHSVETLNLF